MKKKYKINSIFNEEGISLNELTSNLLVSFLDKNLNINEDTLTP